MSAAPALGRDRSPIGDRMRERPALIPEALAAQRQLPWLDADDPELVPSAIPAELAWRLAVVPVRLEDGMRFATAEPPASERLAELEDVAGPASFVVTTVQRIKELLPAAYREDGLHRATHQLRLAQPEVSAHIVVTPRQRWVLALAAVFVAAAVALDPVLTAAAVLALVTTYYFATNAYKLVLAIDSLSGAGTIPVSSDDVDERSLPRYTILVPLYEEAAVVELLTRNLRCLDYPPGKLEVLLLCEEDDDETIAAIEHASLPESFHLVRVPDGRPRTKPRACNYGLLLTTGELCVIYDAEDRPDPDQLKKAVAAFTEGGANVACVQAKLNFFNRHQNLLTRWFAGEYAMWFDLVLPGLHRNRHPIPLGGTSNHFRTPVLRELGAWDPCNVTEDADLGIRLWKRGYRTVMVDSVTLEEANSRTGNWLRQRSRWIKGYIQTWLVHMRRPLRLLRAIGFGPFLSLQLTVGGFLVTLLNPLLWALMVVALALDPAWLRDLFPGPLYAIAVAQLLLGNFVQLYLLAAGLARRNYWDLVPAALLAPGYWLLMSVAAWKGFLQLFTKPFYWEKTTHGLGDPAVQVEPVQVTTQVEPPREPGTAAL